MFYHSLWKCHLTSTFEGQSSEKSPSSKTLSNFQSLQNGNIIFSFLIIGYYQPCPEGSSTKERCPEWSWHDSQKAENEKSRPGVEDNKNRVKIWQFRSREPKKVIVFIFYIHECRWIAPRISYFNCPLKRGIGVAKWFRASIFTIQKIDLVQIPILAGQNKKASIPSPSHLARD